MQILNEIQNGIKDALLSEYNHTIPVESVLISQTRKEFTGDYTIVVFPFVKALKSNPVEIGNTLGKYVVENNNSITDFNVVKGFLNFSLSPEYWKGQLAEISSNMDFGSHPKNGKKVMVEFSSPNTNKPLHLGHIRNILLGWSCSQILEKAGYEVIKTQIINDRGIAICKSMLAWQLYGNGDTPKSTNIKGDLFVGKYYVLFDQKLKEEYSEWQSSEKGKEVYASSHKENQSEENFFKAYKNTYFNQYSILGNKAKDMLLSWEAKDDTIRNLWMMMNSWVYDGFEETYKKLGVSFDKLYYESDTYLLGKKIVEQGLNSGTFYSEDDGSVWIDLEDAGMDKKLILRSDGTSVYITQDIGTAQVRNNDFGVDRMVYVVGDEQDYHFKVLFQIMKRLGEPYADDMHHLSYGMIDLPTGKMKSREGTVVDADDLVKEVIEEARNSSAERGEIGEMDKVEQEDILRKIGLAALKFMIIKIQPKKRMIFDPKESVDMQGQTGPYVQYAYVRIKAVLRKYNQNEVGSYEAYTKPNEFEMALLKEIVEYPSLIKDAAENLDPSSIANYSYNLAKTYHRFFHEVRILNAESEPAKAFRLELSKVVARVMQGCMELLGIEMPEKM
ncbi:MAG: arginine--tRNA ligase [Saprospiraceae bacterium]|nr:arginine--tRNA ligase [Saprospiraceae bacterium]